MKSVTAASASVRSWAMAAASPSLHSPSAAVTSRTYSFTLARSVPIYAWVCVAVCTSSLQGMGWRGGDGDGGSMWG